MINGIHFKQGGYAHFAKLAHSMLQSPENTANIEDISPQDYVELL